MVRPSQLVPLNEADHSTNSVKCKTSSVFPDDQSRLIGWTRPGASSSVRNSHLMPCVQQPTTGAMLWSLTSRAYQQFDQDFEDRAVRKTYLAVVRAAPDRILHPSGSINGLIQRLKGPGWALTTTRPSPDTQLVRKSAYARSDWRLIASSVCDSASSRAVNVHLTIARQLHRCL